MKELTKKQQQAIKDGGKTYAALILDLFKKKIIHPNSYNMGGKFVTKGTDKCQRIATILEKNKIKHIRGNDAPRGGFTGEYIKVN